ncbi:MAG: transglutaminase-like domain-containing protein [Bacteroidota bacterium]|jgi:transglutaminase-like putative cysteine protease
MKRPLLFLITFAVFLASGAPAALGQKLLTSSEHAYYSDLLAQRRARFPQLEANVFSVLEKATLWDEKEALLFLFATSPLSDLTSNEGDFFLSSVRATLDMRRRAPWGEKMPNAIFLHFVLPLRVNNEALDSSRLIFPEVLRKRIAGLSMHDAVLEINHWCHSFVTYAPSDSRTRPPLATILNALGRCGEESVLTTAALRAAGIPARQVYVPRWAHSDDNHAWVEVWVDSTWHFLGACEPDVDLDRAWFTEPAHRAMLTAATVQGRYRGDENVLISSSYYTRINTLPVYAATRMLHVQVRDEAGRPLPDVVVEFRVYNYAEFYPLASMQTGENGVASLRTGFGDLLVWAHRGDRYVFSHVSGDVRDTVRLMLTEHPQHLERSVLDIIPPPEARLEVKAHPRAAQTARHLQIDDSLRTLYEESFIDSLRTAEFAALNGYPSDSCWLLLHRARGNWKEILSFLSAASQTDRVPALAFLRTLVVKDLQDARGDVLFEHYRGALAVREPQQPCDEFFMRYVSCPRIGYEELRPWRGSLRRAITESLSFRNRDAEEIEAWVRDSIRLETAENWTRVPLSPDRVFTLRAGDGYSRDLLFVALCRAAGIPARLEPATGAPQYRSIEDWRTASLDEEHQTPEASAELLLQIPQHQHIQQPGYASHFTLARFENGTYHTLDYEESPLFEKWPVRLMLLPGKYLLTNGNRLPDGSVLATMEFFTLDSGQQSVHDIHIRDDDDAPVSLALIDAALLPRGGAKAYVLMWIERGTEPVSHALLDIGEKLSALASQPVQFLLAGTGGMEEIELKSLAQKSLPPGTVIAVDGASALRDNITDRLHLPEGVKLPLIVVCDAAGRITFSTRGYTIGVGAQILRILERMRLAD